MADNLEGKETKEKFETTFCEYVFSMRNLELNYQHEYRVMQNENVHEVSALQQREAQLQTKYQSVTEAYQEILDSTVWKMTKPIHVLLDIIKRIK